MPRPASFIARAASWTISLFVALRVSSERSKGCSSTSMPMTSDSSTRQRLLEQLLARLVALEHGDRRAPWAGKIARRARRYASATMSELACTWCGTPSRRTPGTAPPSRRASAGRCSAASSTSCRGSSRAPTGCPAPSRARRTTASGRCAWCAQSGRRERRAARAPSRSPPDRGRVLRHATSARVGEGRRALAQRELMVDAASRGPPAGIRSTLLDPRGSPNDGGGRMARFVLVHGAWHGAWCYDALARDLAAAGHEVDTFDLPATAPTPRRTTRSRSTPTPSASRRSSAGRASRWSSSATAWAGSW